MYLSRAHTTYNTRTMTGGLTNYRLKYRRRALPTLGKHYTVHCTVDCTLRPHTGSPDGTHRHAASAHRAHALEATRRRSVEGREVARVSWARARSHAPPSACPSRRRRS